MRYRIPKNELVHEILKSLAEERKEFPSLEGLTREVRNRLRRLNRDYVISAERCRRASAEFSASKPRPAQRDTQVRSAQCAGEI